jgi:hypothetical protein
MTHVVTNAELREIVADLRAMAAVEPMEKVRDALTRLADRYAALRSESSEARSLH